MKKLHQTLLALASLLCFVTPALAQDNSDEEGEVIVIAELSLVEVEQFIVEVEEQFYAAYSAVNEDDDFDIRCRQEIPTGSNIPRRVCEPVFLQKSRADNVNDNFRGIATLLGEDGLRAENAQEFRELAEKVEAAAKANPQVAELGSILRQLQARRAQLK